MDVNKVIAALSAQDLDWFNFGAKAIYVMIYFGITWKLLNVASDKIQESKKSKGGE